MLQESASSSVETVGLVMVVHTTAPIVSAVTEPGSIESIEIINFETDDNMDPTGNCEIIANDIMLIKKRSNFTKVPA